MKNKKEIQIYKNNYAYEKRQLKWKEVLNQFREDLFVILKDTKTNEKEKLNLIYKLNSCYENP